MLNYVIEETKNGRYLCTAAYGHYLLASPQLNKGTAFSEDERKAFQLQGKLPATIETLEMQSERAYFQFKTQDTRLRKNMFLHQLHDSNRTLFYHLVSLHLDEMLPLLYTPMVSTVVKIYSQKFRNPRGLYITYADKDDIEQILENRTDEKIDILLVTDGEGVLGIGDQGIGGMEIAVAKLMVYTLCGHINPTHTLPIFLDVGTNNKALLNDPMYLGWRHPRISAKQYEEFIARFIEAVQKKLPDAFIHWEDLGRENAAKVLNDYQAIYPTFNDDIQGTGVVALTAVISALKKKGGHLRDEKIVIYGAGSAGTGIANQIAEAIAFHENITLDAARRAIYLIDRTGLISDRCKTLTPQQAPFKKTEMMIADWATPHKTLDLETVLANTQAGILIGCSGHSGAFTAEIVELMLTHHQQPIILPLSNPTPNAEATPENLIRWSDGRALIATGSPFPEVIFNKKTLQIAQCNNALIFPAIGLAMIATRAKMLSKGMLFAACDALSQVAAKLGKETLLPSISDAIGSVDDVAKAIGEAAIREGLSKLSLDQLDSALAAKRWEATYLPYKRTQPCP